MTAPDLAAIRPKAYAAVGLLLNVCHAVRSLADIDLESLLIYFCVLEATMRPLFAGPGATVGVLSAEVMPEDHRGSIFMLTVAEELGLPRETVRRKIKALIEKGMLTENSSGRIQSSASLSDSSMSRTGESVYDAARHYLTHLRQYGVAAPDETSDQDRG